MSAVESAARAAVVRIGAPADGYDGGDDGPRAEFWGSGFFIAPGWVLTSAHVVDVGRRAVWRGERVIGITTESGDRLVGELACGLPCPSGDGPRSGPWPDPDLALVRVPDAVSGTSALWLSDRMRLSAPQVQMHGYSVALGSGGEPGYVQGSGKASAPVDGPMMLQGAYVPPGCSGGPVVDVERGAVIGVNKGRSKDPQVARATPITALRSFIEAGPREAEAWHEALCAHDRHHLQRFRGPDWSWPRLQFDRGRQRDSGYALGFNAHDRAQLFGCFAELPPPDSAGEVLGMVQEARREVVQEAIRLHINKPSSWREGVGLLYAEGGDRDFERAAVVLYAAQVCQALAGRGVPDGALTELREWVRNIAITLPTGDLRKKVRDILAGGAAASGARTSYADVLVEIDPDLYGTHPWRIKLVQPDGQAAFVKGNETGAERDQLERDIRTALAEALDQGDVGEHLAAVDFMLPRALFDEPVELWRAHELDPGETFSPRSLPLGHRRTVALRDHHRWQKGERIPEWHQRWRAVRRGQMTAAPLCPGHDRQETQLTAWGRLSGLPRNAVPVHCSGVSEEPGAMAMGVALGAGHAVALWRRCDEPHADCDEFRARVAELLRSAKPHGLAESLRELVRDVRNQSAGLHVSLRGELVLLYDPPHGGPQFEDEPLRAPPTRP
ncbi:trypsin-like peptidase domain-containing protein [Streptomyces sp. HNM0575]|uniref:VMAP-C domain-containing protein n=1 Tax=Streptomyces sp. HNM0575 TaxID=2716338 RepID=UPI00145F86B5|nr:trypsin-like peptidase domain-containing protein [Streptomyces sp. HNM0575]